MYTSLFPRDLFADLSRLQHELQQGADRSPSIRGRGRSGYPALNVGSTASSVEVYAFVPGVKPEAVEVTLDRGVLAISGERADHKPAQSDKAQLHTDERFAGRFRRVVNLPDDIDPASVSASCRDGVLHVSIQRRAATQPRRITVQ
ncbi:MAG: Hsp20/alpha crystallin family protein [Rubrivivax sp.]|nr:Hsp20/alpha crystallin family protein [Rubrivivax sp.]